MDALPRIQLRTEPDDEVQPKSPRLTILDVFVLTACCAVGMMISRLILGENGQRELGASVEAVGFAVVVPCLFGGLIVGHPLTLSIHRTTRRRQGPISVGEACGITPIASIAFLFLLGCICFALAALGLDDNVPGLIIVLALILAFMANIGAAVISVVCTIERIANRQTAPWTDTLGAITATLSGGTLLFFFFAVLSYR